MSRRNGAGHYGFLCVAAAEQHARQDPRHGGHGNGLHLFDALGHVALGNVGQFVSQNTRQFGFMLQVENQAGMHENRTAGHGKGVQGIMQNDFGVERERLGGHDGHEPVHEIGNVPFDLRVLHQGHSRLDQDIELPAQFLFILDRELAEKGSE